MKYSNGLLVLSVLAFVGCSSTPKTEIKEEKIKVEAPTYVIAEVSQPTRPSWILNPISGDEQKDVKKNRYFISESSNTNQRLCVRSAEARATSQIAREIAQFLKNSYTEATQNDSDEVTEYMEEQLAQESQGFISGVQSFKNFWEHRKYKEELGAEEDKMIYKCYALVKMPKKNLEEAVKRSTQRLLGKLETPEVKSKAQKALAGAEQAFANLEKPVQLESSEGEE